MKTIIAGLIIISSIGAMSAASYVNITKVQREATTTRVSFVRTEDANPMLSGDQVFEGFPAIQQLITKMAMRCDEGITVVATSTLGSTTPTKGLVQQFAQLRSDAWYKKGLAGYFAELARQVELMK